MANIDTAVAKRIDTAIAAAGTTRNAVATSAGISMTTLKRKLDIKNDQLTIGEISAIAKVLGIQAGDLLAA